MWREGSEEGSARYLHIRLPFVLFEGFRAADFDPLVGQLVEAVVWRVVADVDGFDRIRQLVTFVPGVQLLPESNPHRKQND